MPPSGSRVSLLVAQQTHNLIVAWALAPNRTPLTRLADELGCDPRVLRRVLRGQRWLDATTFAGLNRDLTGNPESAM